VTVYAHQIRQVADYMSCSDPGVGAARPHEGRNLTERMTFLESCSDLYLPEMAVEGDYY